MHKTSDMVCKFMDRMSSVSALQASTNCLITINLADNITCLRYAENEGG